MEQRLPLVTLVLALTTAALLAVLPVSRSESCTTTSASPESVCESRTSTLLEHEGASVLIVLLVPAAVAAIGVARPSDAVRRGVAIALTTCVVLGAASIGLFFLPTVLAAWLAVRRGSLATRRGRGRRDAPRPRRWCRRRRPRGPRTGHMGAR